MKEGLYTFDELSQYMDKSQEPLRELVKASQEREKYWHGKVEEMQKALKQWEDFAIYLTKITSCSMTKNEISHALNTFTQKGDTK